MSGTILMTSLLLCPRENRGEFWPAKYHNRQRKVSSVKGITELCGCGAVTGAEGRKVSEEPQVKGRARIK